MKKKPPLLRRNELFQFIFFPRVFLASEGRCELFSNRLRGRGLARNVRVVESGKNALAAQYKCEPSSTRYLLTRRWFLSSVKVPCLFVLLLLSFRVSVRNMWNGRVKLEKESSGCVWVGPIISRLRCLSLQGVNGGLVLLWCGTSPQFCLTVRNRSFNYLIFRQDCSLIFFSFPDKSTC